jgi:hypothetical protein
MNLARRSSLRYALVVCAAVVAAVFVAASSRAAGLDIHASAEAADIGLPVYPGAIKKINGNGDPTGFSFGIWGDSFGVKVAVVSYRSVDSLDKVAAFYRDALARYGPVLDCSHPQPKPPRARQDDKSDKDEPVTCDNETVDPGGRLYRVGTKHLQRAFKAMPWHDGTTFELVRVEEHGTD